MLKRLAQNRLHQYPPDMFWSGNNRTAQRLPRFQQSDLLWERRRQERQRAVYKLVPARVFRESLRDGSAFAEVYRAVLPYQPRRQRILGPKNADKFVHKPLNRLMIQRQHQALGGAAGLDELG